MLFLPGYQWQMQEFFFWGDIVGDSASNKNEKGFSVATGILAKHRRGDGGNPSKWPKKNGEVWGWSLIWKSLIQTGTVAIHFPLGMKEKKKSSYQKIHKHLPVDSTLTFKGTVEMVHSGNFDVLRISCCFFCYPEVLWGNHHHKSVSCILGHKKMGSFWLGHWRASFCLVFLEAGSQNPGIISAQTPCMIPSPFA